MSGAGSEKKPSVGNPPKKATVSRNSKRANTHSVHKSPSRSLNTSGALREEPGTHLTAFPSIPEEPDFSSSPSMFSKLFGSGGGEVKRDDTKPQAEAARTNSIDSDSRNTSRTGDAQAKRAVPNEFRRSSASCLQRNTPVRRRSDAEESLKSVKNKNDRAIDGVLAKAFEVNREVMSGGPSIPPSSHRLHSPKPMYSSDQTEVTESTFEDKRVRRLLERMNRYSCLQGCKILFGSSTYGRNSESFEAIVIKPTEDRPHSVKTTIATGLGSSPLEAILDSEDGIECYVSQHKGTWERIQELLYLK